MEKLSFHLLMLLIITKNVYHKLKKSPVIYELYDRRCYFCFYILWYEDFVSNKWYYKNRGFSIHSIQQVLKNNLFPIKRWAALLVRDARDIYADFQFSEDGTRILLCPAGNQPKISNKTSAVYILKASHTRLPNYFITRHSFL